MSSELTFWESATIGGAAGVLEVAVDQPLVTIKNEVQRGAKWEFSADKIALLYKGFGANAAGMCLVTAAQLGANEWLQNRLKQMQWLQEKEEFRKFMVAASAGGFSALFAAPSEQTMMRYNIAYKNGLNPTYSQVILDLFRSEGWRGLTNGLLYTGLRDGGFTAGYVAGVPYMKKKLQPLLGDSAAGLASGPTAGVIAAVATQPLDTWKTWRQTGSTEQVWQGTAEKSMSAAYRGFWARCTRVVLATSLLAAAKAEMTRLYREIVK